MSTTSLDTTTPDTRADKIRHYIELDALSNVLRAGFFGWTDRVTGERLPFGVDPDMVSASIGSELFSELWPDDDYTDRPEWLRADLEVDVLSARLFTWLAENGHRIAQEYLEAVATQVRDLSKLNSLSEEASDAS